MQFPVSNDVAPVKDCVQKSKETYDDIDSSNPSAFEDAT